MKRTIKLTKRLAYVYGQTHYRAEEEDGLYLRLCAPRLHAYFDIPQDTETIYLNISSSKLPQGYLCREPKLFADLEMKTPANNTYRVVLPARAAIALAKLGLIGKWFYINIQYEA